MSGDENFLARWARRKQAVKEAEPSPPSYSEEETAPDAETPAPHPLGSRGVGLSPEGRVEEAAEPLPSVDDLTAESDISGFLRQGVPAGLRQAALRRVWALDPAIRDFVSPAEYAWDFNDPNSIPGFSSNVAAMDLSGFFSGESATVAEDHAHHPSSPPRGDSGSERSSEPGLRRAEAASAAQAGEGAALAMETPSPHPLSVRRVDLSPEGSGEDPAPEGVVDESPDMSPRRHGGALPR